MFEHDDVSPLGSLCVVSPRVCDDAVPNTNRGTHRFGRNFMRAEAGFVRRRWRERADQHDGPNDGVRRRQRRFWLSPAGGSSRGLRSNQQLLGLAQRETTPPSSRTKAADECERPNGRSCDFPSGRQTGNKATQSDNGQVGRYEVAEHLIHGRSVQKRRTRVRYFGA